MSRFLDFEVFGGPFVGCPGDLDSFAEELRAIYDSLPISGVDTEVYYWKKSYDVWQDQSSEPDQFKIAQTSRSEVNPVFILFGNRIGSPVPPPRDGWGDMRKWLDAAGLGFVALLGEDGFTDRQIVPEGKVPMSGTMYELIDVLRTQDDTTLRVFDLSKVALPPEENNEEAQQQAAWCKQFMDEFSARNFVVKVDPEDEKESFARLATVTLKYAFGLGALDPFTDELPGLEAVSEVTPLLFGRRAEIKALIHRIRYEMAPFTKVLGVSGTGKSSLLRAGVMPTLNVNYPGKDLHEPPVSVLVEPVILAPNGSGRDPLVSLGELLTGSWSDQEARTIGPYPEKLKTSVPPLPPATGDLVQDLPQAIAWWQILVQGHTAPVILILDQAEQVDALARQLARDAQGEDWLHDVQPTHLPPEWLRFTGLLCALSGQIDPKYLSLESEELADAISAISPLQLVLSLHRLSALELWPMELTPGAEEVTVEPLASRAEWKEIIEGTCAAFGLSLEDQLSTTMAVEAARLAKQNIPILIPKEAEAEQEELSEDFKRSSVLPQVKVALYRMLSHWRTAMEPHKGTLRKEQWVLRHEVYSRAPASDQLPLSDIKSAINALGETAWSSWLRYAADRTGVNLLGHFSAQKLMAEGSQKLDQLLSRLIDPQHSEKQDLTYLPVESDVAQNQTDLISVLKENRLLVGGGKGYIRLPHRSVLEHWHRAQDWVRNAGQRISEKRSLDYELKPDLDTLEPEKRVKLVERFAPLALNWIGSGHGEDGDLRQKLRDLLVEQFDVATSRIDGSTHMGRLLSASYSNAETALFNRLLNKCMNSLNLPKIAGDICVLLADAGDAKRLEDLLSNKDLQKSDVVNHEARGGAFPLLMAAQNGNNEAVKALIQNGADVNKVNQNYGSFPLLMATQIGHSDIVKILIQNGADVNKVNKVNGAFPLLTAVANGNVDTVKVFIQNGADVNKVNQTSGAFPLLLAAFYGHAGAIEALIQSGADVNKTNAFGTFPLFVAAENGHSEAVNILLQKGAEANKVNQDYGNFALLPAAEYGHTDVIKILLQYGAEVNKVNEKSGYFPLLLAAQNGNTEAVKALIQHGADVSKVHQNYGSFPLLMATQNGHSDIVKILIQNDADINKVNKVNGAFPLLTAAEIGYADVVKTLLQNSADVNKVNQTNGTFSLLQAVQSGHTDTVKALIQHGADVNKVNQNDGNLPLIMAAQLGHTGTVKTLIQNGADVNKVNQTSGAFPLIMAAQNGHANAVKALVQNGADVNKRHEESGASSLSLALGFRHSDIVRLLLEAGALTDGFPDEVVDILEAIRKGANLEPEASNSARSDQLGLSPTSQMPAPVVPGNWTYADLEQSQLSELNTLLKKLKISPQKFNAFWHIQKQEDLKSIQSDIRRTAFILKEEHGLLLAYDILWLDTRGKHGSALLFPGCNLVGMLRELQPPGGFKTLVEDEFVALVRLWLVTQKVPTYAITDPDSFIENNANAFKLSSYPKKAWSRIEYFPAQNEKRVELAAWKDGRLIRTSVVVTLEPFDIQDNDREEVILGGVHPPTIPFAKENGQYSQLRFLGRFFEQ